MSVRVYGDVCVVVYRVGIEVEVVVWIGVRSESGDVIV